MIKYQLPATAMDLVAQLVVICQVVDQRFQASNIR